MSSAKDRPHSPRVPHSPLRPSAPPLPSAPQQSAAVYAGALSGLEAARSEVAYVFGTPVIEAVFPTFFIVSWAHPKSIPVGAVAPSSSSPAAASTQQRGLGIGGVTGWFYQVSWLAFSEASSVPTNITTPLQHVVIPRDLNESRFALQIMCVPRSSTVAGGGVASPTAAPPAAKIVWSRTIDLSADTDALAVAVAATGPLALEQQPNRLSSQRYTFRTAADILSSPALLDAYLLSCATPIGCLPSLPDVLSLMMHLGSSAAPLPSARRHAHRPVLLGQGVLKGINFMGVKVAVPRDNDKNNSSTNSPTIDSGAVTAAPRRRSRRRQHIYYMVCLDDLHASQQASNSGAAAMILRDVFNNATENSTCSSSDSEDNGGCDSEADAIPAAPVPAPAAGPSPSSSPPRQKSTTQVLKLANLWALLESDDAATIVFAGQRSKSAHMCANTLIASLVGQATKAAGRASAGTANSGSNSVPLLPAAAAASAPLTAAASSTNAFTSAAAPPQATRAPFADAPAEVLQQACGRVFSVVFDGPLEDFFSRQNVALCGTARYAAQFISVSTVGMTEEDRNTVAVSGSAAGLTAGPTGLSAPLAAVATGGTHAATGGTVVPESGALIGPSAFASGQRGALNVCTQFTADGSSFLTLHAATPMGAQNGVRAAREDAAGPGGALTAASTSLGGPSLLPATAFVSAPIGLHAALAAPSLNPPPPPLVLPAAQKSQPFGGALSTVQYHSPDVAAHPLGVATSAVMASSGAIGALSLYNEEALVGVAGAALGLGAADALALLAPTVTSVEAAVYDSVFVHVTIRGTNVGMRPLVTLQCTAPVPSPPIEPRIVVASTHCVIAEVRLERLYPLLPSVPAVTLAVVLSTSFGVQAASGVTLPAPGEFVDFLAAEQSVGAPERSWATTSSIAELVTGAITAEPFFCTLLAEPKGGVATGATQRQLLALESIADVINETSSKNGGLFSRLSNAASRVTGRRQLTLSGGSGRADGMARIFADHVRSGRDAKLLASQLLPWRTRLQSVFPWAAKPQLYDQKVRLFYAIFTEMESAAAALASTPTHGGGGGDAAGGGRTGYGDVAKAAMGSDVSDSAAAAGYHGPRDVTLFTSMPALGGATFIEPSFAAAGTVSGLGSGGPASGQGMAATSSNFNTIGGASGGCRVLPTPYMEMVVSAEVLRLCRRAQPDLYTQAITYEHGFRPALPSPAKFAAGEALSTMMPFEAFYSLMFPIFNAHRAFGDVSSEQLLADVATLWAIVAIHNLRMAFLLSKHYVVVGPPKSGATSLLNMARNIRATVVGKSYFRRGGGGRVTRDSVAAALTAELRAAKGSASATAVPTHAAVSAVLSQLREQTVLMKETRRIDDLASPIAQGLNTTVLIVAERGDIGSDKFHGAFIKPLRNRIGGAVGGVGSAARPPQRPIGAFSRAVLVIAKVDEALDLYVDEGLPSTTLPLLVGAGAATNASPLLALSDGYLGARSAARHSHARAWAERLVSDLFAHLECLLEKDAVIAGWRAAGGPEQPRGDCDTSGGFLAASVCKVWLSNARGHIEKAVHSIFQRQQGAMNSGAPLLIGDAVLGEASLSAGSDLSNTDALAAVLINHVAIVLADTTAEQLRRVVS